MKLSQKQIEREHKRLMAILLPNEKHLGGAFVVNAIIVDALACHVLRRIAAAEMRGATKEWVLHHSSKEKGKR